MPIGSGGGSGGSASKVRAGAAYVELGADDGPLRRAMLATEQRLKSFGGTVAKIGLAVGGLGAAMGAGFAPAIDALSELG
jgi:hypothetical protein